MNECAPRAEADAEEACGRGLECVNREGAHDCRCPLSAAHYTRLLERVDALLTADAIYCTGVRRSLSSPSPLSSSSPRASCLCLCPPLNASRGAQRFVFSGVPLALFSTSIARLLFSARHNTHNSQILFVPLQAAPLTIRATQITSSTSSAERLAASFRSVRVRSMIQRSHLLFRLNTFASSTRRGAADAPLD